MEFSCQRAGPSLRGGIWNRSFVSWLLRCYLCAVLPLAAWIAAQRSCCKDTIQEPVFAPSFVAAVIATTCGTYVAILRPGSHNKLLLLLLQAAADQQQFRKLQFCNILAVKYISFFDCHACMLAENSKKLQKKRKPLLDRRKKLCLQFSLSMPCLDRRMRSHVFCLHCSSLWGRRRRTLTSNFLLLACLIIIIIISHQCRIGSGFRFCSSYFDSYILEVSKSLECAIGIYSYDLKDRETQTQTQIEKYKRDLNVVSLNIALLWCEASVCFLEFFQRSETSWQFLRICFSKMLLQQQTQIWMHLLLHCYSICSWSFFRNQRDHGNF